MLHPSPLDGMVVDYLPEWMIAAVEVECCERIFAGRQPRTLSGRAAGVANNELVVDWARSSSMTYLASTFSGT